MLEVRGGGGVREGRSGWEDTGPGLTWDGKWDFQDTGHHVLGIAADV